MKGGISDHRFPWISWLVEDYDGYSCVYQLTKLKEGRVNVHFISMTGNNALSNTVSSVFWHICIVRRDFGGVSFGACGSVLPRFMYCRGCFVGVHALVSEHRPLACFIETEGDDTKSYSQEKQFAM